MYVSAHINRKGMYRYEGKWSSNCIRTQERIRKHILGTLLQKTLMFFFVGKLHCQEGRRGWGLRSQKDFVNIKPFHDAATISLLDIKNIRYIYRKCPFKNAFLFYVLLLRIVSKFSLLLGGFFSKFEYMGSKI